MVLCVVLVGASGIVGGVVCVVCSIGEGGESGPGVEGGVWSKSDSSIDGAS